MSTAHGETLSKTFDRFYNREVLYIKVSPDTEISKLDDYRERVITFLRQVIIIIGIFAIVNASVWQLFAIGNAIVGQANKLGVIFILALIILVMFILGLIILVKPGLIRKIIQLWFLFFSKTGLGVLEYRFISKAILVITFAIHIFGNPSDEVAFFYMCLNEMISVVTLGNVDELLPTQMNSINDLGTKIIKSTVTLVIYYIGVDALKSKVIKQVKEPTIDNLVLASVAVRSLYGRDSYQITLALRDGRELDFLRQKELISFFSTADDKVSGSTIDLSLSMCSIAQKELIFSVLSSYIVQQNQHLVRIAICSETYPLIKEYLKT